MKLYATLNTRSELYTFVIWVNSTTSDCHRAHHFEMKMTFIWDAVTCSLIENES